ncbi:MAG: hypothetical protein IH591_19665 [Bacteroidales bacterium]|nr:hypothetical protein [Bacteroidales bacterium]
MKIRIILAAIIVSGLSVQLAAQNPDDALRYSQQFYSGTARFSSMGGAFTALGGDLSSIGLNPAGTGIFRSFEFTFTPHFGYNKSFTYFTENNGDFRYSFNLGQFGVVMPIIQTGSENGLVSLNFAYSYNMTNDFNANTVIRGTNSTSSMADYWASISNGTHYTDLDGVAGMAYDAWVIDTITGTGGMQYGTVFSQYGDATGSTYGQTVRRVITNEGFSGEHSFSVAANYNNNLFAGVTLGLARFNYTGHYEHLETDPGDDIFDFNSFSYVDHYEANGTGFSLKAGLIYLPVEFLRVGLAVHTPTIYRVNEYYYEDLSSSFDDGDRYEFNTDAFRFDYRLITPFRLMGGAAVQFQKLGLVSVDYELVDYSMARFSKASDGYDYYGENESIGEIFTKAHNIRAGAEFRLGSLYFRGGYGYYGTVFSKSEINNDSFNTSISGGIGFRQSGFFFDMGFSSYSNSLKYYMYNHQNIDPVTIETTKNTFIATVGLKF